MEYGDFILYSTKLVKYAQSDHFAQQSKDVSLIRTAIDVGERFTVEASQAIFDKVHTNHGKHLYSKAVVDCINVIAKKASSMSWTNSVCCVYDDFHKDYDLLEHLRKGGHAVPGRSTVYGWLTGKHSTCRLIMLNGIACLLNKEGFMRPFIPGLDTIIELVVAEGLMLFQSNPESRKKPMSYLGPLLTRFLLHDSDCTLFTALLQSISLAGHDAAPKNPGPKISGVSGGNVVGGNVARDVAGQDVAGRDVTEMGGSNSGVMSGSGTIYQNNYHITSPPPMTSGPVAAPAPVATPAPIAAPAPVAVATPVAAPAPVAVATPRRPIASSSVETKTIGTFIMSCWDPQLRRWKKQGNRVTVDMFVKDGTNFFAILDGSTADSVADDSVILFDIDSNTFKFELKNHCARGEYIEIGREAFSNGTLGRLRCILDSGKMKELFDAYEKFKTTIGYEPPSPSVDEEYEAPSDGEE